MKCKILLVDDNDTKRDVIVSLIQSVFLDCEIECATSYNSAMKALKLSNFDIMLLDMSMPTFDQNGGTRAPIKPLAGRDVLNKIKFRKYKIEVIVITQFDIFGRVNDVISLEDLEMNLLESFPENFKGCVFYDPRGNSWSEQLVAKIKEVCSFE